jgi:hypothetical protein
LEITIAQAETYEAVDLRVGEAYVACELAVLTLCRMLNLAGDEPLDHRVRYDGRPQSRPAADGQCLAPRPRQHRYLRRRLGSG